MKVYDFNICKFDFFDTAVADILRAVDGRALMGAFILSFCCIDYMGMAITPTKQENTSSDFKKFISDYLQAVEPRYKGLEDHLWAVRNSLIHVYGSSKTTTKMKIGFSFSCLEPKQHLRIIEEPSTTLWFNLPEFVSELLGAIELFFRKHTREDELLRTWYGKLLIVQSAAAGFERLEALQLKKPIHSRSHQLLGILDHEPPLTIREIIANIREGIQKQVEKY